MEENNYYEDKKNRQFLDNTSEKSKTSGKPKPETKQKEETQNEKLSRTAKEVGTDVAVGMLGGGLGAAIFGSYSFFAGLLVSGYGHYTKNKYVARLGLGMMASSSMKAAPEVKQDPKAGMLNNIQERVKAFGQELQRKLLLDKLLAGKNQKQQGMEGNLNGVETTLVEEKVPDATLFMVKNELHPELAKPEISPKPLENEQTGFPGIKTKYRYSDDDLTDASDHLY